MYFLLPKRWAAAFHQVQALDKGTNVSRALSKEELHVEVVRLNNIYGFFQSEGLGLNSETGLHDFCQGIDNQTKFRMMSMSSAKHSTQRGRIDEIVKIAGL
jgi:hypothetical protein